MALPLVEHHSFAFAIHKVCWPKPGEKSTCSDSDKWAAIDDANAIADDVDVLSMHFDWD